MNAIQLLIFLTTFLLPSSSAALSNVTIDDQNGDPTNGLQINYNPPSAWQKGQTCSGCKAKVTPASDAWMGTWMDASYNPSGNNTNDVPGQIIQAYVSFTGVAVYVNAILIGTKTNPIGNTDYTFYLDNDTEDVFQKAPDGDSTYRFNQTVFSRDGLDNTLHTLRIEAGHSGKTALILLDSVIYTTDDGSSDDNNSATSAATETPVESASSSSTPVGIIVGPIIAGVVVLGVILAFLYRRRQRKNNINNRYNHAKSGSSSRPINSNHMFWAGARPYSVTTEATGSSDNMSSLYPSTIPSHQTSHRTSYQTSRYSTTHPESNLYNNHSRIPSTDMTKSSSTWKFPRKTAQLRAVTELDESVSGSEVISPPAYNDVSYGTSPNFNFSQRHLPMPRFKN